MRGTDSYASALASFRRFRESDLVDAHMNDDVSIQSVTCEDLSWDCKGSYGLKDFPVASLQWMPADSELQGLKYIDWRL